MAINTKKITANYHTHTYRCKHATGDVIDYAAKACEKNLKILGMADHSPFPDRRWSDTRMDIDELDSYDQAIITARKAYPNLKILKGMECDWAPDHKNFYIDEFKDKRNYDYLMGGLHYFRYKGEWIFAFSQDAYGKIREYTDAVIKMIESKIFDFIAHPDLFGLFTVKWDTEAVKASREICEAAKEFKIPLEINGGGFRRPLMETNIGIRYPYPVDIFWEIASDYGIEAICSSDAHSPNDIITSMDLCEDFAKKKNLSIAQLEFMNE
ncbi:MAG: histidinol-phosphatase [Spirochaetaceae bacterium]|nr:histidinol-phosphatase [Spirochaetaceae bacterium]MCL2705407.1 histidinol-phosphatase [Spirochaetaceae bacterium]